MSFQITVSHQSRLWPTRVNDEFKHELIQLVRQPWRMSMRSVNMTRLSEIVKSNTNRKLKLKFHSMVMEQRNRGRLKREEEGRGHDGNKLPLVEFQYISKMIDAKSKERTHWPLTSLLVFVIIYKKTEGINWIGLGHRSSIMMREAGNQQLKGNQE